MSHGCLIHPFAALPLSKKLVSRYHLIWQGRWGLNGRGFSLHPPDGLLTSEVLCLPTCMFTQVLVVRYYLKHKGICILCILRNISKKKPDVSSYQMFFMM